ncbi:cellulose biosynthesis cyclic di-GMP-binding regulatory protein BcsB [Pararhizobium sp. DWP1-1-3]|uniref:cellulose biosynthesis cyclic di-GMP-binding regulatory protein BcsB n=1 Tax=Pararhizobium sp. DWP1-1-3 TaxID=2804652 RepID=UPI003CE956F4
MAKPFRTRTASLSLALIMAQTLPLSAQSLLDAAPSAARILPGDSESILSTRPVQAEAAAAKVTGLVPFEQALPAYHLSGEDAVARLSFNLASDQAASGGQLALAYRNAVSVLPDTSVMDVEVNGRSAGTLRIASPNGFKSEALTIGAGLLKPGRNQVVLRARQYHRVDCSLEATYELWSELDPSQSGFVAGSHHGFRTFADLLTVARTDANVTDIRLVLPQAATAEMLNDAAPALQTLALFMNREDLAVTVGEKPGTGPGIDLYVSTDKTGAQARDADGRPAPYGLSVRDAGNGGRAAVSLRGATRADMSSQLLQAIQGPLKESLDSGIFSRQSGAIIADASTSYTLSDAGYETRVFSGRLSRTGFNMVMPADFYPADYATIGLKLSAATSPGLKRAAQFLVRVNDRVVTSYPFRNTAGEQFDGKLIELPLRAFRPGNNKVELLAELPVEADETCAPEARDDTRPRFILLKDTRIEIPALARIGRLPDIGALAGTAYPYADGRPFDIFIERPDAQSAGAALTMLSRLALAARNPLNANIRLGAANPAGDRNALVISTQNAFAELGSAGKSAFPVDGFQPIAVSIADVDPIRTATIGGNVFAASPARNNDDDSTALLDAFRKSTTRPQDTLSVTSKLQEWFSGAGGRFGKWLNYQDGSGTTAMLRPGHSLLTLTQTPSPSGEAVWTVVHAGSPADIALGVRRLVEPAVWQGLSGGSAEIETASLAVNTVPAGSHFIAGMTDQSPSNIRRLAAAWFSDNFQFYVLLIVGLMGIFAVWLGLAIPRKGVRSDQ